MRRQIHEWQFRSPRTDTGLQMSYLTHYQDLSIFSASVSTALGIHTKGCAAALSERLGNDY